jgi:cell division protein FtsZ
LIRAAVDPGANIIFGVRRDEKMDKEVKITLVATGFAAAGLFGQMEDEEVTKLLRSLKVEDDLDVPSFMRKSMFNERRTLSDATTTRTETRVN